MASLADCPAEVQSDPGPSFADDLWVAVHRAETRPADFDSPSPAPAEPTLPFAEWLEAQASLYRWKFVSGQEAPTAAAFAARLFDAAAEMARALRAETPDQYEGRLAVQEEWARERIACGLPCHACGTVR